MGHQGSIELDELISASEEARAAAARAVARSEALVHVVRDGQRRAVVRCMASRAHRIFVRVQGIVGGVEVAAVVRTDGGVSGDRSLLRQAKVVAAMGDRFDSGRIPAALGGDPLAAALTLIRACDRVIAVELACRFSHPDGR